MLDAVRQLQQAAHAAGIQISITEARKAVAESGSEDLDDQLLPLRWLAEQRVMDASLGDARECIADLGYRLGNVVVRRLVAAGLLLDERADGDRYGFASSPDEAMWWLYEAPSLLHFSPFRMGVMMTSNATKQTVVVLHDGRRFLVWAGAREPVIRAVTRVALLGGSWTPSFGLVQAISNPIRV